MISDSDRSEGRRLLEAANAPSKRVPVCEARGHGNPDWCSVHGDIDRHTSILSHLKTAHGLNYDQYRTLEEAEDIEHQVAEHALIVWLRNHATELLRDHRLADAFHDVRVEAAGVAAYKVELAEKVRALRPIYWAAGQDTVERAAVLRLIDPAPSEGGEGRT